MDCKLAILLVLGLSSAFGAEFHDVGAPAEVGSLLRQLVSDGNATAEPTTTEAADVSTTETAEGNGTTTEEADEGSTTMAETTDSPESTTMAETTAATGGGETTTIQEVALTTTTPAAKVVNLAMTVIGLDYAVLQADSTLRAAVISAIKVGIVQELNSQVKALNLTESDVETTLREAVARRLQGVRGLQSSNDIGVVAESVVTLPATSDASRVASIVKTTASALASTVSSKIQAVGKIVSATLSGVKLGVVGVTAVAPTPAPTPAPTTTIVVEVAESGAVRAEVVGVTLFAASLLIISLV